MTPRDAWAFLSDAGYLSVHPITGWGVIRLGPTGSTKSSRKNLDAFVRAIKVLGAHSVGLSRTPATVQVSRGRSINELQFRLVDPDPPDRRRTRPGTRTGEELAADDADQNDEQYQDDRTLERREE